MTLPVGVFKGMGLWRASTTSSMESITTAEHLDVGEHCFVSGTSAGGNSLYHCINVSSTGSTWSLISASVPSWQQTLEVNHVATSAINVENSASFAGPVTSSLGFSGSLTRLIDGSSYLVEGANVTITSQSNGSITIASSGGGGGSTLWTDEGTAGVSQTGSITVGGDGGFVGYVSASLGFSGSLTRLTDGSSYLVEGTNITITSESNGSITIGATTAGDNNASYIVVSTTGSLTNERVLSGGLGIQLNDNGANSTLDINIVDSVVATVSGTTFTGNVLTSGNLEVSGTALIYGETSVGDPGFEQGLITYNSGVFDAQFKVNDISQGRDALTVFHRHSTVDAANIVFARSKTNDATHAPLDPGDLISRHFYVSWASGSGGAGYVPAAFLDAVVDGPTEGGAMPGRFDFSVSPPGVPSPALALRINSTGSIFENNVHVSGTTTSESGFSGSLTRLVDGSSYLVAGANVTITSQSNGSITIASTGDSGSVTTGIDAPVYYGYASGSLTWSATSWTDITTVANIQDEVQIGITRTGNQFNFTTGGYYSVNAKFNALGIDNYLGFRVTSSTGTTLIQHTDYVNQLGQHNSTLVGVFEITSAPDWVAFEYAQRSGTIVTWSTFDPLDGENMRSVSISITAARTA